MSKDKQEEFVFGDMITNNYAGDSNPHKIGMYIKKSHKYIHLLFSDGNIGMFWLQDQRKEKFLHKTGENKSPW